MIDKACVTNDNYLSLVAAQSMHCLCSQEHLMLAPHRLTVCVKWCWDIFNPYINTHCILHCISNLYINPHCILHCIFNPHINTHIILHCIFNPYINPQTKTQTHSRGLLACTVSLFFFLLNDLLYIQHRMYHNIHKFQMILNKRTISALTGSREYNRKYKHQKRHQRWM